MSDDRPRSAADATRRTDVNEVGAPDRGPRPPGPPADGQARGQVPQDPPPDRVPYEAQVFGRMSVFGLGIGAVYWFLTYETAGSVLLFTFGIASGVAAVAIFVGGRGTKGRAAAVSQAAAAGRGVDREPVPAPGWAPVLIAIGLGGLGMGLALGPWLSIAGILFALAAAGRWLSSAMTETDDARGVPRRVPEE